MANLPLYLDVAAKQLVKGISSTAPARLPVFYRGDKVGINLFFLQPTGNVFAPYDVITYATPSIKFGIGSVAGGAAVEQDTWAAISGSPSASVSTLHSGDAAAVTPTVTTVQSGNGTSIYEIQDISFDLPAVSGWFSLKFDNGTTSGTPGYPNTSAAIPYNATIAELQAAVTGAAYQLSGSTVIPAFAVQSYFPGKSFRLKGINGYDNWSPVVVNTSADFIGGTTHEVQKVAFTKPPIGGYFTLTFTEGTTSPIAWNTSATKIRAIINDVLGPDAVAIAGDALSDFFTITWADYVNHTACTIDTTNLVWTNGGYTATLDMDATAIDTLLDTKDKITNAILEIEVTVSSKPETLFHDNCTVSKDIIT